MKLAICYAGQGAQKTGMGQAFYDNNKAFHAVFDRASSALDFDLKRACFQNPEDILMQTEVTQPALVAFASGVTAALEEKGILQKAAYVLGLSLGEYSALEAAGVWGPEEAVKIAAFRGKAMASAAEGIDCAMSAVIGLEKQQVEDICSEVMKAGESGNATGQTDISGDAKMVDARQPKTGVWLTNDNCPGQVVISGDSASVAAAGEKAAAAGGRVMPLHVSGPFHTPWMAPAGDALKDLFKKIGFGPERIPVVHNFTARPQDKNENLSDLLAAQVQNGVRMRESIDWLLEQGVDTFLEVGPGHTITGFVRKCAKAAGKSVQTLTVETPEDLLKGGWNEE